MRCGNGKWPQGEITIQNWGNVELWKESRQQNYMERPLLEMIIDRIAVNILVQDRDCSYRMNKKSEEVKFGKIQLFLTELQHGHSKNRWIPHRILKCVLDKVNWYGFPELPFIRYHIQFIFETFGQRCLEIKYKNTMLKRILD